MIVLTLEFFHTTGFPSGNPEPIVSFPNVNEVSTICEDVFDREICITSNTEGGVAYFDSSVDDTVSSGQTQLLSWFYFWFNDMKFIVGFFGPSLIPL